MTTSDEWMSDAAVQAWIDTPPMTDDGSALSTARVAAQRLATEVRRFRNHFKHNPVGLPPIPMLLTCPSCGERHIDEGEFATKPHHTHACQHCGMCWRPAVTATVGVQFLPGFKDER